MTNYAKANFEEISNKTNGNHYYLDVDDKVRGSEKIASVFTEEVLTTENLTNIFTEEVLRNAGSLNGLGDKLLNDYKSQRQKGYFN